MPGSGAAEGGVNAPDRAGWPEAIALCLVLIIFAITAPQLGNPVGWLVQ